MQTRQKVSIQHLLGLSAAPHLQAIGGGSINEAYKVTTDESGPWFCKINDSNRFPDLFPSESFSLSLLHHHAAGIRTPAVIACGIDEGQQILILEWIEQGLKTTTFWQRFGEQLAAMHRQTAPGFGLEADNYMGSLPQSNSPLPSWPEFFIQRRLAPQLRLAVDKGLIDKALIGQFERFYGAVGEIFSPGEPPALVHGDLWSGNFLCDQHEQPVLIDPAAYYGHRSVDLAMTTLFGGFAPAFYEAYDHHYPFPPNYRLQWEVANVYPLLIHVNLFGNSYLADILRTIRRF